MMPRFARKPRAAGPPPTFLCRNRQEVTRALAEIREHLGISQLELDEVAGFCSGYTGKMERLFAPGTVAGRSSGRSAFPFHFDNWLGALKVGVVLVPLQTGSGPDHTGAKLPRVAPPAMTVKRAQKMRALHRAGRSRNTLWRIFQCTPKMVDDILAGRAFTPQKGD